MVENSLRRQRNPEDNPDTITGTFVKITTDIDQEVGGRAEIEIHEGDIVCRLQHLHEFNMVMHRADEHRGLMHLAGKINGQFPVDQLTEDLGSETLTEKTPQHRLP